MDIVTDPPPEGEGRRDVDRLLPQHLTDLRSSGLSDAQIAACGFYSEDDPAAVAKLLNWKGSAERLGPCLCIPFTAPDGKATGYVRVKPDNPRKDKNGKPAKYESPRDAPNRPFFPPATRAVLSDPAILLLVTEGEKKCAKADQDGFPCIGLVGVYGFQKKRHTGKDGKKAGRRELLPDLAAVAWAGRKVCIVYDSDAVQKPGVQWAEFHFAEALAPLGADVRAVRLPSGPNGEKVGLDDFLRDNGPDALRALIAAATTPARPERQDDRPEIAIGTDQFRVNAEAAAALAAEPDLYQRAGSLVQVLEQEAEDDEEAVIRRPVGSPLVREIPPPLLQERLTRCARFVRVKLTSEGEERIPAHPPGWCVQAVHARGRWPHVRRLEAVVSHPVLLRDGSILSANGYDPRSRLLVAAPPGLRVIVPDRPTTSDVAEAVATLNDVLADFPFEEPAHRAAWFAGLLTPLAWFAFDGSAPLFLIDANVRGAGKGLLGDVIALAVTGRRFPTMSYTNDREELRKKITTLAVEGERLVMLDNLAGAVGNDVLDAALTSDRWKDRLLGANRGYDGPLNVTWFGTGNNVQLHADTARRVCHVRMETQEERPELKSGFKYPDLRAHVAAQRGALLSAALTVLRAWVVAGKPRHGLPAWGSFEGWSAVVREAVVFAGLPDPGETRLSLQTSADRDAAAMTDLISCLERLDPERRGVTAAQIVDVIKDKEFRDRELQSDLRSAVEDLCGRIDGRAVGYKLRHFARRNFGGKMIDRAGEDRLKGNRWAVRPAGATPRRPTPSPASPASPATEPPNPSASPVPPEPRSAGDAGDAGDAPARGIVAVNGKARRRFSSDDRPPELRG